MDRRQARGPWHPVLQGRGSLREHLVQWCDGIERSLHPSLLWLGLLGFGRSPLSALCLFVFVLCFFIVFVEPLCSLSYYYFVLLFIRLFSFGSFLWGSKRHFVFSFPINFIISFHLVLYAFPFVNSIIGYPWLLCFEGVYRDMRSAMTRGDGWRVSGCLDCFIVLFYWSMEDDAWLLFSNCYFIRLEYLMYSSLYPMYVSDSYPWRKERWKLKFKSWRIVNIQSKISLRISLIIHDYSSLPLRPLNFSSLLHYHTTSTINWEKMALGEKAKIALVVIAYNVISISMVFINKFLVSQKDASIPAPLFVTWYPRPLFHS